MRPLDIYTDISVLGGCLDEEFSHPSNLLVDLFVRGLRRMVLSRHTVRELELSPPDVRNVLEQIPTAHIILIEDTPEALGLADQYIERGAVTDKNRADALHIALASLAGVDALVSWNFKHMVNLERIRVFHAVNLVYGYPLIPICTPWEVLEP
jgi:hypothetical protein